MGVDAVPFVEEPHKCFVVRRPEHAADPSSRHRRILNDDPLRVVAVELLDGLSESRLTEGEITRAPGQGLLSLSDRLLLHEDITIACARNRSGRQASVF